MIRAEELLGNDNKPWDESSLKTVQNGTKINKKAFEDLGKPQEEIPADAGRLISNDCITNFFNTFCIVALINLNYIHILN